MGGKPLQPVKFVIDGNMTEQLSEFTHLGSVFAENKSDTGIKLETYNKLNVIKRYLLK